MTTTKNSKLIDASAEACFRAFTDAEALEQWLAPGEMTGKVHQFELREGGGYIMSLYYPEKDGEVKGKSDVKEDRYCARFVELRPNKRIVEAIEFDTTDARFMGEMIMEVGFIPEGTGTRVELTFSNIPPGIRPEDNEKGTELSLEKLAKYAQAR
jgi:uncharacterized protein YndB with AHSA1/START domain